MFLLDLKISFFSVRNFFKSSSTQRKIAKKVFFFCEKYSFHYKSFSKQAAPKEQGLFSFLLCYLCMYFGTFDGRGLPDTSQ